MNPVIMNPNRPLPLASLQDGVFTVDSSEILAICEAVGLMPDIAEDITGIVLYMDDSEADYKMVYLTESSRPYDLTSVYVPLPYYRMGGYNAMLPQYWQWATYF